MRGVRVGLVFVAFWAGCGGRSVSQDGAVPDMPVLADGPRWPDTRPPDVRYWWSDIVTRDIYLPANSRDYVISRLVLPDTTTASKIGHDYDSDGTVDNALGAILGGLSQMAGGSLSIQEAMDTAVNQGSALVLLRLQASSFVSDPAASAQTWLATPEVCCTAPQSPPQCAAQAKATCFGGNHVFQPDPAAPQGSLLGGPIAGTKFVFGPGPMRLPMILGGSPVTLDLTAAYIKGTIAGTTITDGILAGAIKQSQLQSTLIPSVAQMLNATLMDPATDPQVKAIITSLFDMNQDGTITTAEVLNSTIIKTFLGGDKDVDNDGVKELTLGMAFEVATAVIVP